MFSEKVKFIIIHPFLEDKNIPFCHSKKIICYKKTFYTFLQKRIEICLKWKYISFPFPKHKNIITVHKKINQDFHKFLENQTKPSPQKDQNMKFPSEKSVSFTRYRWFWWTKIMLMSQAQGQTVPYMDLRFIFASRQNQVAFTHAPLLILMYINTSNSTALTTPFFLHSNFQDDATFISWNWNVMEIPFQNYIQRLRKGEERSREGKCAPPAFIGTTQPWNSRF